jgi:hypothetical protein
MTLLGYSPVQSGKLLANYTALQPIRQPSSYSPPWESQILISPAATDYGSVVNISFNTQQDSKTHNAMERGHSWKAVKSSSCSRHIPPLMKHEASLQFTKQRATGPHSELDECSSHPHIQFWVQSTPSHPILNANHTLTSNSECKPHPHNQFWMQFTLTSSF